MSLCTYRNNYGFRSQIYPSKRLVELSWTSVTLRKLSEASDGTNKAITPAEVASKNSADVGVSPEIETDSLDVVLPERLQNETDISLLPDSSSFSAEKLMTQDGQRKSLSSKFFESKSQNGIQSEVDHGTNPPVDNYLRRPKPYGDDATEIAEKSPDFACTLSSSDEEIDELSSEIESKNIPDVIERNGSVASLLEKFSRQQIMDNDRSYQERPTSFPPYMSFTAGDGNPVRHSLINLVMEEDVPVLLEAMAEKLNFEFEDLTAVASSSSEGIIRNSSSNQRKKQRNVSRIGFSDSPPAVFSYPDEVTATEFSEWHPGEDITFEEYQQICEEERQKYEEERLEANKWQASFIENNTNEIVRVSEQPTVGDFALGVTSRISYSTSPSYNPNSNFGATSVSLIAGK